MKKFILIFTVLIGQFTTAQVSNYNFALLNGTYTALSGGTVFQSANQVNSDASLEVSLPNSFTIAGTAYNSIRIYNNGFITLGKGLNNGQIMDSNVKYPISNTVKGWSCDYVISCFGANVVASQFGNPSISYGLNANNDFTIQYQDVAISGFTQTRANVQIVLKSDGSTIQFVYGPNNVGQFNVISPQVGLRGKAVLVDTNDAVGTKIYTYPDWQTRSVSKGSNANIFEANSSYPNNSKGKLSSSTVSWSNAPTILPNSGLIFQFSPN